MFYDFGTSLGNYVPCQIFGKICRKSEPFADFMHVGLFPLFTFLELYKPHGKPSSKYGELFHGAGGFHNPEGNPNTNMVNCSMGPEDFKTGMNSK